MIKVETDIKIEFVSVVPDDYRQCPLNLNHAEKRSRKIGIFLSGPFFPQIRSSSNESKGIVLGYDMGRRRNNAAKNSGPGKSLAGGGDLSWGPGSPIDIDIVIVVAIRSNPNQAETSLAELNRWARGPDSPHSSRHSVPSPHFSRLTVPFPHSSRYLVSSPPLLSPVGPIPPLLGPHRRCGRCTINCGAKREKHNSVVKPRMHS